MRITTITRINRYHFCEEIRYPGYDFSTCDLFLSPEWFEDFSTPVPVSFWEEVASRTLGFPYRKPGGYLKKMKLEEDLVTQENADSPEFTDLEHLDTNDNGENAGLHESNLWMNLDKLRRGVHWHISRIEPYTLA